MIKINYFNKNDEVGIAFYGDKFLDILTFLKEKRFKFNVTNKYWTSSIFNIFGIVDELKKIDEVIIQPESIIAYNEKKENRNKNALCFVRQKFDKELLKVPPLKGVPPYENYQLEDIGKGITQNRLLLAHEQGLGKTFILINIINYLWFNKKIDKILIIVPFEAMYNWRRELLHFSNFFKKKDILISMAKENRNFLEYSNNIIITTYRHFLTVSDDYYKLAHKGKIVKKYRKATIPFEKWGEKRMIICDESHCFTYNTLICTNKGNLKIGDIVEKHLKVKILSYNHYNNKFEYKKIKHYFKNIVSNQLLTKVYTTNNMKINSTYNHPFFNGKSYNSLKDIIDGESLQVLQEDFQDKQKNNSIKSFRLDSVKILERRNFKRYGNSDKGYTTVYNLEIKDNNNYFANNFLVHNCIKNLQSRQAHVLHLHKDYFYYRYLATGTPDPNGINGYYSQINFLDTSLISEDYYTWLSNIANIGNKFSEYSINYFYADKVEKFIKSISSVVIRRKSEDCLDLPELRIKKVYVPLNKEQEFIYKDIIRAILKKIFKEKAENNESFKSVRKILNKFPFLSLALDNPSILKNNKDREYDFGDNLNRRIDNFTLDKHSKIEVLDSLVKKYINNKQKIIIWSGHPLTMNELAERYKKYSPIVIHGQIKIPKEKSVNSYRDELLEKFRNTCSTNLLIASYKVLSTAINIVEANIAIYFDRSYDLKDWLQSIKRIHRYGQSKNVIIHPIIIEKTIDERLDRNLNKKEDINKNLFNRDSLTKEEWEKIFLGE